MLNRAEQDVADFLQTRGLRAERFTKREIRVKNNKTPDFRVFKGNDFQFYCEVKETTDADPIENHLVEIAPGVSVAHQCLVDAPGKYSRFANRICDAVEQFDNVNPNLEWPNVLAFVNSDEMCKVFMLEELLLGHQNDFSGYRFSACPNPSLIKKAQSYGVRVHLFLWFDRTKEGEPIKFFPWKRDDSPTQALSGLFEEVKFLRGRRERES